MCKQTNYIVHNYFGEIFSKYRIKFLLVLVCVGALLCLVIFYFTSQ